MKSAFIYESDFVVKLTLELKILRDEFLRDDRREEEMLERYRKVRCRSCGFGREGGRKVCGLLMNSEHESVNSDA